MDEVADDEDARTEINTIGVPFFTGDTFFCWVARMENAILSTIFDKNNMILSNIFDKIRIFAIE